MVSAMAPLPPPLPRDDAPEPEKKRSGWKVLWIVLGAIGAVILLLLTLGLGFTLLQKELPVGEQDKQIVVQADVFEEWLEGFSFDAENESWQKLKNIDGTYELNYEYDSDMLYVSCMVGVDDSRSDAKISYVAMDTGSEIGAGLEDMKYVDRRGLLRYGDESRAALIRMDGDNVGNYFACRKGKNTIVILWTGVYFEDSQAFRDIVEPVLDRWARYRP